MCHCERNRCFAWQSPSYVIQLIITFLSVEVKVSEKELKANLKDMTDKIAKDAPRTPVVAKIKTCVYRKAASGLKKPLHLSICSLRAGSAKEDLGR